ncbi:hypothetical protein H0G86_000517 [Trichoderma simmonsii]|uniref:Uncharacterized protein n=1 Tax=Trichoderma simmonsii TaxID=1491479 RepID=A0A8G0L522_9HYPO|nr:hypothetical protein H0G86_000517 [Trichoderma simmonsii]
MRREATSHSCIYAMSAASYTHGVTPKTAKFYKESISITIHYRNPASHTSTPAVYHLSSVSSAFLHASVAPFMRNSKLNTEFNKQKRGGGLVFPHQTSHNSSRYVQYFTYLPLEQ